ncbi:unnamed protein product [Trichobilharzia regenti]|nr:unnamed protein product [Trichobilharzia regenti]
MNEIRHTVKRSREQDDSSEYHQNWLNPRSPNFRHSGQNNIISQVFIYFSLFCQFIFIKYIQYCCM